MRQTGSEIKKSALLSCKPSIGLSSEEIDFLSDDFFKRVKETISKKRYYMQSSNINTANVLYLPSVQICQQVHRPSFNNFICNIYVFLFVSRKLDQNNKCYT